MFKILCLFFGHRWIEPTSLETCGFCKNHLSPKDGNNKRKIIKWKK